MQSTVGYIVLCYSLDGEIEEECLELTKGPCLLKQVLETSTNAQLITQTQLVWSYMNQHATSSHTACLPKTVVCCAMLVLMCEAFVVSSKVVKYMDVECLRSTTPKAVDL